MSFEAYTQRYDGTYPWRSGVDSIPLSPPGEPGGSALSPGYWDLSFYWPGLMHEVQPWREHFASWLGGGARRNSPPWSDLSGIGLSSQDLSSFEYCTSFFARPAYWRADAAADEQLFRPVRTGDVLSPGSKAMLYDRELPHQANKPGADTDLRAIAFADGHVSDKRLSRAATPLLPAWDDRPTRPLHDTPNGVRGSDY
jgi:hypothetical protein